MAPVVKLGAGQTLTESAVLLTWFSDYSKFTFEFVSFHKIINK